MPKVPNKNVSGRKPRHRFSIFIASSTSESEAAVARLRKICDDEVPGDYEIEIVDLSKNPQLATKHRIVATPTILRTLPAPLRTSIGNLSSRDRALLGLDLVKTVID